jgi:hypothetical protein
MGYFNKWVILTMVFFNNGVILTNVYNGFIFGDIFKTFTAHVLDDNMHGIAVINQVLEYADLPAQLKSKLGDFH